MPLANLSAILQALPLLITLGAALVFGDRIGWRRMTAILAGLIGVLIIIRPGTGLRPLVAPQPRLGRLRGGPRPLGPTAAWGYPSTLVALGAAVAVTLMGWTGTAFRAGRPHRMGGRPHPRRGLFLIVGYLSSVAAMRHGISASSPRSAIPRSWAIVLGFLVFGNLPDFWTLIGRHRRRRRSLHPLARTALRRQTPTRKGRRESLTPPAIPPIRPPTRTPVATGTRGQSA
jgi:drug/metabolite transporter (DMT)-like permease